MSFIVTVREQFDDEEEAKAWVTQHGLADVASIQQHSPYAPEPTEED